MILVSTVAWAETPVLLPPPDTGPSYHLVGWANTFMPGAGQALLGNYGTAAFQLGYEGTTFALGYHLSSGSILTLDGFISHKPTQRLRRTDEVDIEDQLYGDILQEFAIKAHMVNTFESYRIAAFRNGKSPAGIPAGIDDKPVLDLFLEPFNAKNLTNPYVYLPMTFIFFSTIADYVNQVSGGLAPLSRLTPYSNTLFGINQGVVQPMGSGAPEEMFYRGFVQNEAMAVVPSPYFAIPVSTALFTFSHAPGDGRPTAAVAGGYLGYLMYHNDGRLGPGIALHFWADVMLGLEEILLNGKGQRTTPPATFSVQVNY